MADKKKKLNKRQRRALDHAKSLNNARKKGAGKVGEVTTKGKATPPRTSHYDKKSGKHKSGAEKVSEDKNTVTYRWVEDGGGENVQVRSQQYTKDHAKARFENESLPDGTGSWVNECGNHCKINKDAQNGKFKRFKKEY
jgi:hypothetical protein